MNNFKSVYKRFVYDNFFRPSRLSLYDKMLSFAITKGYEFVTIIDFWDLIKTDSVDVNKKYLIIRHDIDTDPKTAYQLFLIEKKYNIKSTYYYRLKTLDETNIQKMLSFGCEICYHYEEIGTIAKLKKIKSKEEVDSFMNLIQDEFVKNYNYFLRINPNMKTIASHGDFVNANYLKLPNHYLIDETIRNKLNIEVEAYDSNFMKYITCRVADLGNIEGIWTPISFFDAINNDEKVLYLLIHPRQWYSRISSNIKEDAWRIFQTIKYKYL